LKTGDYSVIGSDGASYENSIAVERKSIGDLIGSLTGGHDRFKRELERGSELEFFMILIEGSYSSLRDDSYDGHEHHKWKGLSIIKMLWTLKLRYGVNFVFTNGRIESERMLKDVFRAFLDSKEKNRKIFKDANSVSFLGSLGACPSELDKNLHNP
jgi:ERCC4-type nuclease